MSTTADQQPSISTEVFERYAAAWTDHDIDRIMAMHTDDTEFQLHDGSPRAEGLDAVRAAFEQVFALLPDLRMDPVRLTVAGELIANEYTVTATPAGAQLPIQFEVVDVIELRDGLVRRKDAYLDSQVVAAAVGAFQ